jgi:peptide/nickel transport system permease protein
MATADVDQTKGKNAADELTEKEKERLYQASQWQLIWWKFRKHKLARLGAVVLALLYLSAFFCEFVAPYGPNQRFDDYKDSRPHRIHFFAPGVGLRAPFIYAMDSQMDPATYRIRFVEVNKDERYPIRFFVKGSSYKLLGFIPGNVHLFGTGEDAPPLLVFGTDRLGRDILSRTIYGARISLTIGLVGVALGFVLGIFLGGISGYFGGVVDMVIQRLIEFLLSLPTIPLWMALAAALPRDWSITKTYFFITIILSFVGWCRLAREVRGKLLALREEDFVVSARLAGSNEIRTMAVHLFPSFASHLIVSLTLAIPLMILGETALSFLGLGMQPPAVSWGVLLQDAQNVVAIAHHPWKLIPAAFVILAVLMFNFLGDGLRDAADPYAR